MLALPLLLLLATYVKRISPSSTKSRQWLILLLCWSMAGYIVWRESILKFWWDRNFLDWTINPMVTSNPHGGSIGLDRLLMPLTLLGRYTSLLIFPIRLSPDYGAGVIGWTVQLNNPYLWIGIATVVGWWILFILSLIRRWTVCLFALTGLALTYGLVGNFLVLIGTNFAERLMYLPSAFFLIPVVILLNRLGQKTLIGLMVLLLIPACLRSFTYAARWNDRLNFYQQCLQEQPDSIRLRMLLASELAARHRYAEAEQVDAVGRKLLGEYWGIWIQSGDIALQQNKFDQARQFFEQAMNIRPSPNAQGWLAETEKRRCAATQPAQ